MHTEQSQFIGHTSCEACGSTDANATYDNNTTYCFSCEAIGEHTDPVEAFEVTTALPRVPSDIRGFKDRQITKVVAEFFGVTVSQLGGEIVKHYYPYFKDGALTGYKVRECSPKAFKALGDKKACDLFGQQLFSPGNKVIVVEGELDALMVAQAMMDKYGKVFPVVSVPDGAGTAAKAVLRNREWLRSFKEVIVMFDMDKPGQDGANEVAKMIGADKVKIAKLTTNDPCDEYAKGGEPAISNAIWNAVPWQPAGIVNGADTWEEYINEKDAVYQEFPACLGTLNHKIHGVRTGSLTTITSGTGCGKTTVVKEILYHILKTTEAQIGLISLEESVAETVRGFISLDLSKRIGLPGVETTMEDERGAFNRTLGTGRISMLDHQGSCEDSSLTDKLEFLALSGCKYIVLDHITIAVSESKDGNTNQAIDTLMSTLLKITKRHECHITVISHLRKVGGGDKSFEDGGDISLDDLKGSGSLKQISAQVIALSRNLSADNDNERHTVKIKVLKDRWTGNTGWAGAFKYDQDTGRLVEAIGTDNNGFTKET